MAAASNRAVPRARGLFGLGNTLQYLRDPLAFITDSARTYGDVVQFRFPGLAAVQVTHPDVIEHVLRHESRSFQKDWITRDLKGVVGEGLLTSEGDFWRRQRRLSQPAFLQQQVLKYVPTFADHTSRAISTWRPSEMRDVHVDFTQITVQIAAKTLFDADVSTEAQVISDALQVVMQHFFKPAFNWSRWPWLPTPAARRLRNATREIDRVVNDIIQRRRASRGSHGDLLDRLLAAQDADGSRMTDRQLRDEFVTILLAGHETTALTLSFALFCLAENPDAAKRLAGEVQEVLGDRAVAAADLPKLIYTAWCVKESMRLYPPAWIIGREALAEVELGGYRIPRLHRQPFCDGRGNGGSGHGLAAIPSQPSGHGAAGAHPFGHASPGSWRSARAPCTEPRASAFTPTRRGTDTGTSRLRHQSAEAPADGGGWVEEASRGVRLLRGHRQLDARVARRTAALYISRSRRCDPQKGRRSCSAGSWKALEPSQCSLPSRREFGLRSRRATWPRARG